MHPAVLILAAASADPTTAEMLECIRREVPRIERIEENLESVARIVVNVVCADTLRRQANEFATRATTATATEPLARGYEFRAVQMAIEAREARLGVATGAAASR